MKIGKEHIRLIAVSLISAYLVYRFSTYWESTFLGDVFVDVALGSIILIVVAWPLLSSLSKGIELKRITKAIIPAVAICSGLVILGMEMNRQQTLDKPSILRINYDGDFNGTSIDFKEDGTFIFDNYCMGSSYKYGTYELSDNRIMLSESNLDNVIASNNLVIGPEVDYGTSKTRFVVQVDEQGKELEGKTEFRVVIDNRK